MRVATQRGGGRDGSLTLVTDDGLRAAPVSGTPSTFQAALDDWETAGPTLQAAWQALEADADSGESTDAMDFLSPLPRAYEWCEGSTFLPHMERMRGARGMALPPEHTLEPIVYQAGASALLAPTEDIPLPDEDWGLDLEATLAVITDHVPQGTSAAGAADRIRFVVLTNDLTYRNIMPREYAKSVGPYQAKPTRAYAPFAVSLDALGDMWDGRKLHATVKSWVNGELLGAVDSGKDHAFDFADLIEYLTRTRSLAAGTLVGSGAVSNRDVAQGFGCLGERRALELAESGQAVTPWLRAGDRVRIEAFSPEGVSIFGAMDQTVVDATG